MAHTINAVKRHRQALKRQERNKAIKSRIRTQIKKVLEAIEKKDKEGARREYLQAVRLLDKAAGKGIIHANKAARHKSRLASRLA